MSTYGAVMMDDSYSSVPIQQLLDQQEIQKKKRKYTQMKIAVATLALILSVIIVYFLLHLKHENAELYDKIEKFNQIDRLNSHKVLSYEDLMARNKAIEQEKNDLLKQTGQLLESEKSQIIISSNLRDQIKNINLELYQEGLKTQQCKNDSQIEVKKFEEKRDQLELLIKDTQDKCSSIINSMCHPNTTMDWHKLQSIVHVNQESKNESNSEKKPKAADNNTDKQNQSCTNKVKDLQSQNEKLQARIDELEISLQEEMYARENKASSLRGGDSNDVPIKDDSFLANISSYFHSNSSGAEQAIKVNQILFVVLGIFTLFYNF